MKSILKACGRGLLYVITFPVMVAVLSLLATVGIIVFIVLGTKTIILFFKGQSLFKELPEDIEVKRILASNISAANGFENSDNVYLNSTNIYPFGPQIETPPKQSQDNNQSDVPADNNPDTSEENNNEF